MSEAIAVASIQAGSTLLVLLLGWYLNRKVNRISVDTRRTRDQVENNHFGEDGEPINLREEADHRHNENSEKLDRVLEELTRLRKSVGRLWERADKHTDQIHELELTQPPKHRKARP